MRAISLLALSVALAAPCCFAQRIIDTIAGGKIRSGVPAQDAFIGAGVGMARDKAGNIVISDFGGAVIRRVRVDGIIETIAGTGALGFAGDGGPAISAGMNAGPMVYDSDDNLYVSGNGRIRKITPDGIITTVAGIGILGPVGGDGPAASVQ